MRPVRDLPALRPQPARSGLDWWATPACLARALVQHVLPGLPGGTIWEAAAGDGALADAMHAAGRTVFASDLRPRAAGIACHDFLHGPALRETRGSSVVTNPPFNELDRFIARGLALLDRGDAAALVLLVRNDALTAAGRAAAFNRAWAQWVCCWRPTWLPGTNGGGRWSNAWIVWRDDQRGPPITRFLTRADCEIGDLFA